MYDERHKGTRPWLYGTFFAALGITVARQDPSKLATGTWKLNVEKSDFGKDPKPKGAMVKVVHKEPAYKYSYTGTTADGQTINVEFDGAIDGKPYKETGPEGGATVTYRRINDSTVDGTWTSPDGKTTVTFTSVVSKDGKVYTRKSTVQGTGGGS